MEKGVPIRAVSRALTVLQVINRNTALTMTEIAKATGLPYPTVCRLVQTLLHEGFLEREANRKKYRPTALVQSLSHGVSVDDRMIKAAKPIIEDLTEEHVWPFAVTTRIGVKMMVRESTHASTSLTLSVYHPGYTLPILESSSGRAYLAYCTDEERLTIASGLSMLNDDQEPERIEKEIEAIVAYVRKTGVATYWRNQNTANPGKTSSLAGAIFDGSKCVGSLALVYFDSAMSTKSAVKKYSEIVSAGANEISEALASKKRSRR